ncbi:hypothetical protein AB0C77_22635 [Streptomyces sp. NPDC048629]|uniref:hypothetical protein n=1 Tax=Streptomyces sp. NPDC048629 TaxID=3154824 RepID=UPI00341B7A2C
MAHLTFDEDETRMLRDSARERAADGDGLLAYALQQLAAEGVDLTKVTPYAEVQARYGLGDAARTPGTA